MRVFTKQQQRVYLMDKRLQNINVRSPLSIEKIASIKSLVHFIPRKRRFNTERRVVALNKKSISGSFQLSTNVKELHRNTIYKRRIYNRNNNKTYELPRKSNEELQQSQNNSRLFMKSTLFSPTLINFLKQKKRRNEFFSVVLKQKRMLDETEIQKNTRSIQIEMQKRQTMIEFQKIQTQFMKKSYFSHNKQTQLFQKIRSFSKDYIVSSFQANHRSRKNSDQSISRKDNSIIFKTQKISLGNQKYFDKNIVRLLTPIQQQKSDIYASKL